MLFFFVGIFGAVSGLALGLTFWNRENGKLLVEAMRTLGYLEHRLTELELAVPPRLLGPRPEREKL
jgi:hypothetical protein